MRRVDYAALIERTCGRCHKTKPIDEFSRYDDARAPLGWRYSSRCRECNRASCRAYGADAKPKRNARLRAWRRMNPDKAAALDRRKRLAEYGLTEAGLAQMIKDQGGACLLCDRVVTLVIDHCHETDRVRGLLCHRCNTFLGWLEAHPVALERLSAYLDQPCHADVLLEIANA